MDDHGKLEDTMISCLNNELTSRFFSTYPYYVQHHSSKKAIQRKKSGNCIALSYGLQSKLKKNGFKSFLVPASVPKKYRMVDYSQFPICHVAVCVVISKHVKYILDPAFYYQAPLRVKIGASTESINVYQSTPTKDAVDKVMCREIRRERFPIDANPKSVSTTLDNKKEDYDVVVVSYENDPEDDWEYHLVEVLNPDSSIGLKYLHMKKEAFLCMLDENWRMKCMVKQRNPPEIMVTEYGEQTTYPNVDKVPVEVKRRLYDEYGMKPYLNWGECKRFEEQYSKPERFEKLKLNFRKEKTRKVGFRPHATGR